MSVNVSLKKALVIVAVLLIAGGSVFWFVSTKDERAAKAEYELLIRFAQRQSVEIAIIEQQSKLLNYKQQMAKITQPIAPNPFMPTPFVPPVADPDSVIE